MIEIKLEDNIIIFIAKDNNSTNKFARIIYSIQYFFNHL